MSVTTSAFGNGAMDYLQKLCEIENLLAKAQKAAQRKKTREARLFEARTKPYISERERSDLTSKILGQ